MVSVLCYGSGDVPMLQMQSLQEECIQEESIQEESIQEENLLERQTTSFLLDFFCIPLCLIIMFFLIIHACCIWQPFTQNDGKS